MVNTEELLTKMIAPGQLRPSKPYLGGVIQIHVTRACDKSCFGCTQGSNLGGKTYFMPPDMFELAVRSLKGYFGVRGLFGGNPALSPYFSEYCAILQKFVPFQQRGIWCNHPKGKGKLMAETFNPKYSNLNVHLDREAEAEFKRDWPSSITVGLLQDSRHSPPWIAMKDIIEDEEERNELISKCTFNHKWSAMMCMFRGELRAFFCEEAGAQAILHQEEEDYPDTGLKFSLEDNGEISFGYNYKLKSPTGEYKYWWQLGMSHYKNQVKKHCHECSIPLNGYGQLACASDSDGIEQVSKTHQNIYKPKRVGRRVELVTVREQVKEGIIQEATNYIGNARR